MRSQILCPDWQWLETKEKRGRSGVGQLSAVEAVVYILEEEDGDTQFGSFLTLQDQ